MLIVPVLAFWLVACAAIAEAQDRCSVLQKNLIVRDVMTDLYLWRTAVPNHDPAGFDSPEAYLEALRYRPLDETFSYITSRAASEALFNNSEYVGFGFSTVWRGAELGVSQVYPGGPAEVVGLRRGDVIVEINDRSVADLVAAGEFAGAFGPAEAGVTGTIGFRRGSSSLSGTMMKRVVTIPTVSDVRVLDVGSQRVGYIFFRNFVEPSSTALDDAFAELKRRGVTELVLDLRYNGGGLVSVAQQLGGLIGGSGTGGQIFAEYVHNDRYASHDRILRFERQDNDLRLERLVVITTRASASASELIINALRPFMPVVVIGDRTYGKPVGQYAIPFCDLIIAPVSFSLKNADGQGDFFAGFAPTCAAADDLSRPFGDPAEASLSEALYFLHNGRCSLRSSAARQQLKNDIGTPRPGAWLSVLGAH